MPGPRLPILAFVALLSAIVALVGPSAGGHAEAGPLDALCDSLRQRVAEAEATDTAVGIVVADLGTGGRCAVNAHETFRAASLYKLIVLVEAFEQNARGDFSLDEPMVLDPRHFEDDPPALRPAGPLRVSGGEAVRRMVTISDNGAATALVERLDPAALVAAPARLGLTATSLEEPFLTTPADVAQLFSSMYRGDLVSAEASEQMLALLLQQERNDLVPAALPAGSVIAHKTGRIEDYVHDAGIVYAPGGDYVVVLLTRWRESPQQSQRLIRDLAARVHGAFEVAGPPPVQSIVETAPGEPGTLDRALARPPASALAAPAPAAQIAPAAVGGPSAVERPGGSAQRPRRRCLPVRYRRLRCCRLRLVGRDATPAGAGRRRARAPACVRGAAAAPARTFHAGRRAGSIC